MEDWSNPNNDNDDWYSELDLSSGAGDGENTTQDEEVKPVKIGKKGVVIVCVAFFIVLFIVSVLSVGWFSGGKSRDKGSVENTVDSGVDEVNNSASSADGVAISSTGGASPVENTENAENAVESASGDSGSLADSMYYDPSKLESGSVEESSGEIRNVLVPVKEPVLDEVYAMEAVIEAKNVYRVGSSYVYSVNMSIEGLENHIGYYCPRKTYDALVVGDIVSVEFQMDNNDTVSVVSVSK